MFIYRIISDRTLEIVVEQDFETQEVDRALMYIDALVESTIEVIFKVKPKLKNNLVGLLQSNKGFPLYPFTIQ